MYKKAREIEELSVKFYQEKSAEVDDPARKRILERLAAEEERHFFLMENLVRMLGQPYTWLENAEFVKLDRYEQPALSNDAGPGRRKRRGPFLVHPYLSGRRSGGESPGSLGNF